MLLTLLAWIYISLVCWSWGMLTLRWLKTGVGDNAFILPSFPIICITGLAAVTVLSGFLSLWMPLGSWLAQGIIICPCLLLFFQKQFLRFPAGLKKQFISLHPVVLFLLVASLLMILLMSTWTINHPDTLAYHAQTIHWIENYKIIPGLVHLYTRYGYQGQWFVSCAFFSLRFTGTEALTFINSTVLLWYLLFIIQKINTSLYISGDRQKAFLWLLLFIASCLSYTQLRLTASSASPDFIATLLIWAIFYLLLEKDRPPSTMHWTLLIVLSIFSVTLKLSAMPILLVAVYAVIQLLQLKKVKALAVSLILAILVLAPFLSRNIITTGYLVFPSTFPDITRVDWKFNKEQTAFEKSYITAYARAHVDYAKQDVETVMAMPMGKWLPGWWQTIQLADKAILIFLALSLVAVIVRGKLVLRSSSRIKIALLVAVAGIVFWFIQAPDPRFGFGFILAFPAIVFFLFSDDLNMIKLSSKKLVTIPVLSIALAITSYSGYRFLHFFSARQLIQPLGIEQTSSASFPCEDILFHKPADDHLCGDLPLPCIYTDSCNFILRGNKITDGFKAKGE